MRFSPQQLEMLKMCDNCRVAEMTNQSFDPYGAPQRPLVRTTDDYLRERESEKPKA